jgi:hypothetical protein
MPIIEVPGMGDVEFPDDMSDDQIASAIKQNMPAKPTGLEWTKNVDPSLFESDFKSKALNYGRQAARAIGLSGRTILNTAASLPLAAADAGIAARNLYDEKTQDKSITDLIAPQQHQGYDSATKMWNDALNNAGVPQFETPIEKGGDIVGQMLLGSKIPAPEAAMQAPTNFNPQSMRQLALQKAQDAGYVVPPSTTNPSVLNRFLESWGGKTGTAQDASLKNQGVTDALVKGDLGLKASDDVAEGTLAALRKEASDAGYKPLRGVGTLRLDGKYQQALDDIASPYTKAQKTFPGIAKTDVADTVQALKQGSVDSDTAVDTLSILRDKADAAYRAGDKGLGKAYKSMAGELENAIERSLNRRGASGQEVLKNFRDARQQIAKTYTAEKALNPELGSFDARKLAQELNKGKPLSGDMKKVAQASQAFKEATRLLTDSGSVRNTDVILGAGTAALSGNPAPLLYPFSRMAMRDFLLSKTGQSLLTNPSSRYGASPELLMGGSTGLLGP